MPPLDPLQIATFEETTRRLVSLERQIMALRDTGPGWFEFHALCEKRRRVDNKLTVLLNSLHCWVASGGYITPKPVSMERDL